MTALALSGVAGAGSASDWPSEPCAIQTSPVRPRLMLRCGPSAVPSFSTVYGRVEAPSGTLTQAKAPWASRPVKAASWPADFSFQPS
ncbi:hypothetical protein STANM309S_06308 [Streptomyces tanashiensis]